MTEQHKVLVRQVLFYGAVGGIGTLGHYALLAALVEFFDVRPVLASSLGFILGAIINHELNRLLVFPATTNNRWITLWRFMIIAALGFVVNLGVMTWLTVYGELHYFVAQIMATGMVFVSTFILNKIWTFNA
ncbi:GtrA family protein [Marinobacter flavimaris]|uniref:GtrA family protein n=1 Tax=Marinobacter flavimaris TaxID=262076 RepID=UPI0038689CF0